MIFEINILKQLGGLLRVKVMHWGVKLLQRVPVCTTRTLVLLTTPTALFSMMIISLDLCVAGDAVSNSH